MSGLGSGNQSSAAAAVRPGARHPAPSPGIGRRPWGATVVTVLATVFAGAAVWCYARFGSEIAGWLTGRPVAAGEALGQWGDSFGALNAAISASAFIGILITLQLQRRGLREQAADQHRQRFDASFFELVGLQREARRELLFFNTPEFEAARTAKSFKSFSNATTGRLPANGLIDPIAAADLEVHFRLIEMGRLDKRSKSDVVEAYMRYVHSASESTIAPYFRLVYSILDRLRQDAVLTEDEKVRYGNLLRSQMSSAEVLLLGINSLAPISADMSDLVSRFRMLKYLPQSSMRALLSQFHDPEAFTGRDDPVPPRPARATAFDDPRYRRMIAAIHAERKLQRLSRKVLASRFGRGERFVADYEEGWKKLDVADLVDVAKALRSHPALFLRH